MPQTYKQKLRLAPEDKLILDMLEQGYTLRSRYHSFKRQLDYQLDLPAGPLGVISKRINKLVRRGLLINRGNVVVLAERKP